MTFFLPSWLFPLFFLVCLSSGSHEASGLLQETHLVGKRANGKVKTGTAVTRHECSSATLSCRRYSSTLWICHLNCWVAIWRREALSAGNPVYLCREKKDRQQLLIKCMCVLFWPEGFWIIESGKRCCYSNWAGSPMSSRLHVCTRTARDFRRQRRRSLLCQL